MNANQSSNASQSESDAVKDKLTGMAQNALASTPQVQALSKATDVATSAIGTGATLVGDALGKLGEITKNVGDLSKEIKDKKDDMLIVQSNTNGGAKKLNKVAVLMKKAADKLPSLSDISNKSLKNKVKTAKKKLLKASHKAKQASKKIMKLIKGGRRRSSSSKRR